LQTGGAGANPSWTAAPAAATPAGLDKNRPAASVVGGYIGTDSGLYYLNDGTNVRVFNLPEKSAYGGFTDTNYLQSQSAGATVGPTMASTGYTILVGINIVTLPGATTQVIGGFNTASTDGWYMAIGNVSNKISIFMTGLNGGAYNNFTGMTTLTTGPHLIAISWDGTSLTLVCDGGSAVTLTPTGTYTAPSATARVTMARYSGSTGFAFANGNLFLFQGYASALSTGDKQTLTATPSNYFPGVITANAAYSWSSKIPVTIFGWKIWGSAIPTDGTANIQVASGGSLKFYSY
jgi:hypothetical protein